MSDRWWWGAPGATLLGTAAFFLWIAYGGGDANSGNAPLIRGVGLIVVWILLREFVDRASRRR